MSSSSSDKFSKSKHSASKDWRGSHFLWISLVVTTLSIIFFFAGSQFLNKLDLYSPVMAPAQSQGEHGKQSPWWVRWTGIGGTVLTQVELRVKSEHEAKALEVFRATTQKHLDSYLGKPLTFISTARIRDELLSQGWISEASVRKVFPNKLEVELQSREPSFVLRGSDSWILADSNANLIAAQKSLSGRWIFLPRVFGLEDRLQGDIDGMSRQLIQEKSWLKDLAQLLATLKNSVKISPQEITITPEPWTNSALFKVKGGGIEVSLLSERWKDRVRYLQYVLSELKEENPEFTAKIEGQYPHKWYVQVGAKNTGAQN